MPYRRAPCARVVLGLALLVLSAAGARGQEEITDAMSRESTSYNDLTPRPGAADVMSREWTTYNSLDPLPDPPDVHSREFTVYHGGAPPAVTDVVSRELTAMNDLTAVIPITDAASREFTVYNFRPPEGIADVFSREFTAFNDTTLTAIGDIVSREFVAWNLMPEGIEDDGSVPEVITLLPARPNPLTGRTTIPVGLPHEAPVTLAIFDVKGACVAKLYDHQSIPAGWHNLVIDATGWSRGVYFYRLQAGDVTQEAKIILRH